MINGIFLIIPLFLIRYGLLAMINKDALSKAAFFPPMQGRVGKAMYWVYQLSTILIIVYMFFLKININNVTFVYGLTIYCSGVLLFIFSTISFAKSNEQGMNQGGMYYFSRNPMYVSYFVYFIGSAVLVKSVILLLLVCSFQIAAHWIILAEEKWCIEKFGNMYIEYMKKTRRYI